MWQILATLVFGVGLPVCSTAQPAATTSSIGGAEVPSARQRGLKLVLGNAGFNRLTVEQRENLLSGRTMCATSYLAKSEQPYRTARPSRVASYADLPTVGDHLQNKKYRLVLIFIATAGHDSARPVLIRNSFLPGRVPATTSSTPNWMQNDTLSYDTYVKDAIEYFFDKNSYGALDVDVVIPYPPNSSSPIWVSPDTAGYGVVDSVLKRIETSYPDSFFYDVSPPSPYDYQRVGYLFTDTFATGWCSSDSNELWASEAIRDSIWDGATFAGAAWAGTGNPLWPDVHSETFAWQIIHEMLHHITYANASHPSFADRGVREFGTRTWGFDIMDHGGKACATNGHYGAHALAPIDKYLLGFIEGNWLRTITTNTTDVRLSPNHVSPPSGGRLLARIPLSSGTSGTESFVVSNHQGIGIDEVYNPGMGDSLNNGLHIWHIGDGFELGFQSNRADVEVAWTIALGDTFCHPEGQSHNPSSWAVSQYLPTEYSDNFDWIDGVLYDSPLYPSMGGKGLYILNQAYGGWSAGGPGIGNSTAFCNHNSDSGTLRWEHLYDRNIITPTINDFFRPGNAFTPYSRPNTDKYHRYAVTSYADSMVCTQGEPQEDRPRDGNIMLPLGGAPFVSSQLRDVNDGLTRVGIVNIRQETNGDMLFDVYFNFWEGEFNDARNFGYLKRYDDGTECESGSVCWRNVWESMTLAGVAHDTVVVGPNGFLINTGRKITVKTGTTMKVLGPITVEGTLAVESGVIFDTIKGDIVIASGGRLELGSNVTLPFDLDHCKDLHVDSAGTLIGSGPTSVIEGPINVRGRSATVQNVKVLFADPYGTGQSIVTVSNGWPTDTTTLIKDCILSGAPNTENHYGIGCFGSSPRIRGVAVDTVYAGIYAYNGSDPVIYRSAVYDDPDCEGTVTNNLGASCYYGVQAYLNSEYQGGYYNPPNTRFGGNNFRRANSATGAHVYASNTGQQKLDYNYWNGGPDVLVYNGAYATTYPQCGSPFPRPGRSGGDERQPVFAAIDSAVAVLADHDTTGALDNLRALAGRQTEAMDALFVLDRITELCSPERVVSLTEGLRTPESRPAARQAAMWVMGRARHAQGELLGAAQWYAQVRELDADSLLATESKFAEAELLFDLAGQRDRALVLFREFLAEASVDNPNRVIARGKLKMAGQDGDEPEPRITRPASPPLLTARPNPFNPTTSITYRVTAQGNVSVQVYNALGQRVRELVNTAAPAGTYTVVWDGKDSAARPVGSGVYLIRLTTPAAVVTERVTL
ncbi:MAG TPA: FlgD immunoglobulin-like domain containing protein, partial [Candidatus Latescibacteria bacterium]|nr:FlgD immunoglobulin-like domain containing protein [Candidatus Latescibacterota bacterium]